MSKVLNESTPKIISAFAPVQLPPEHCNDPVSEEDIVDTLIIDTYETDEEGNVKPITKQIEIGRKNRKAYIESFADDCGLDNILKKIGQGAIAEDKYSILNSAKIGQVSDLRGLQDINNLGDIEALARKAEISWKNLDPQLKKNMSFQEFVLSFKNDDLVAYIKDKKEAATPKAEGGNE